MAFRLTKTPHFSARVTVLTPTERATFSREAFTVKFRRTDVDESIELQKLTPREAMERVIVGWEEFLDEENQPVPFNDATRWALLSQPHALIAINDAFWNTLAKAREKN